MFPINLGKNYSEDDVDNTLHSTMFPINPLFPQPYCSLGHTLHSTMFPINLDVRGRIRSLSVLYIPLCFLLIEQHGMNTVLRRVTLHSTMFPINLFSYGIAFYIEASLHSTMFPINRFQILFGLFPN